MEVDSEPQDMGVGVAECGVVSAKEWEEFQEVRRARCRENGCNKEPSFCAGFTRHGVHARLSTKPKKDDPVRPSRDQELNPMVEWRDEGRSRERYNRSTRRPGLPRTTTRWAR